MDPYRPQRVAEAMREELEEMIGYELEDPRISSVIVTEVLLAPDNKEARVRLSLQDSKSASETLEALEHARHYLRRQLAVRLQLRRTPDLHFEADAEVDANKVKALLKRVRKGRPREEG